MLFGLGFKPTWNKFRGGEPYEPSPERFCGGCEWLAGCSYLFMSVVVTQGVVKNIIPAIASTNAVVSAACTLEALKIATGCSITLSNYLTYNGAEGLHMKATEFERDPECLVCGPGVSIELNVSITLQQFIEVVEKHPKLKLKKASVTYRGTNLYMQAPTILEEMTRCNLRLPLFQLMANSPIDVVHVMGTVTRGDNTLSSLIKLRLAFVF